MKLTSHQIFNWHENANIRSISSAGQNTTPQTSLRLNGIHFIVDVDCESTLRCLQQVIANGHTFCVHPEHYQPATDRPPNISSDTQVEAENDATSNKLQEDNSFGFFQCLSAGSHGNPKRIQRTHKSWLASFAINANLAKITQADSYAIIGRLSHSLALYAALEAAHIGADVHALGELRPDKQLRAIGKLESSILYATPTQLRLLCESVKAGESSSLQNTLQVRHIFCGGGKLDQRTVRLTSEVFRSAKIREFYGATETSFVTVSDDDTPLGSVGKAYPGVDVHVDATDGGGVGEIWVKSPYLFHSYAGTEDLQHAARWRDGFVSVGEIGHIDKHGYLYLAGRQSRRVNIADTLVYPEEIENLLNEHPAVTACALTAIADKKRGSVLVATIVANGNNNAALRQTLLVYIRERVGNLKAPRDIIFVANLPYLASGKPDLVAIARQRSEGLEH